MLNSRTGALLLLLATLLLPALGGEAWTLALRYEHDLLATQWWRLLSGHWVHLGWSHTLLNAMGLILVWLLVGREFRPLGWSALLLVTALGISAMLWLLNPQLIWYVGFSGVLHGLLVAGAWRAWRGGARDMGWLLLLLGLKLLWEQLFGALPGSVEAAGGPVVVDAHLYGAICGLASLLVADLHGARKAQANREST